MKTLFLAYALLSVPTWNTTIIQETGVVTHSIKTGQFFDVGDVNCAAYTVEVEGKSFLVLYCLSKDKKYNLMEASSPCTPKDKGYIGLFIKGSYIFESICVPTDTK